MEILMATRWSEDDLTGAFAYEEDGITPQPGWRCLNLAAIAGPDDPLGREEGASLCPQLAPLDFLLSERAKSPVWFSALFQGSPSLQSGNMFGRTLELSDGTTSYYHYRNTAGDYRFRQRSLPKDDCIHFMTVDTAASLRTRADWTVVSLWAWHPTKRVLVLVDRKRDRVETTNHQAFLTSFYDKHAHLGVQFVGIENKTFGTNLINEMRRDQPHIVIVPIEADKDKLMNAVPYAEAVKAGNVWFPHPDDCHWSVVWENEHAQFPDGKWDDQVDTGSMAWNKAQAYVYTEAPAKDSRSEVQKHRQKVLLQNNGQHPYLEIMNQIGL